MGLKDWKKKLFPDNYDEFENENYDEFEGEDNTDRTPVNAPADNRVSYGRPSDNAGVAVASRSSSIEMKVVSPTKFEAVTQIADLLLSKKTVLLNLENTNKETAKRLIDFLSGVAYALGGDIQKVADNTFAVTPNNVAVSNEVVEPEYDNTAEDQYE